jgi:hypothetical protein
MRKNKLRRVVMARGRKKAENITLEEQLEAVVKQIEETKANLKNLRQKRKEIEVKIKDEKKEKLYKAVVASGKSIDEILAVISEEK